jgi:hypothetical protein
MKVRQDLLSEVVSKVILKLNENTNFYNPTKEVMDKLEGYINDKMNEHPEYNLQSWIYTNLIRKTNTGGHQAFEKWMKDNPENSQKFRKLCNYYLSKYSISNAENKIIVAGQDDQNEWLAFNFNRKIDDKDIKNNKVITYNYYITFERTPENFKAWINSLHDLISKLYSACKSGSLKDSAVSMKFGYHFSHYLEDNDHIKFYWYKTGDESKVEGIVNDWLSANKIGTTERPYSKGIDTKAVSNKNDKDSWGTLIAKTVNDQFEKLLKQYGKKYTPKQYAKYIVDMLNNTKFKF